MHEVFRDALKYISPRLSTVAQNAIAIGETAAELLLAEINGKEKGIQGQSVKMPVMLIKGETVAPPK